MRTASTSPRAVFRVSPLVVLFALALAVCATPVRDLHALALASGGRLPDPIAP